MASAPQTYTCGGPPALKSTLSPACWRSLRLFGASSYLRPASIMICVKGARGLGSLPRLVDCPREVGLLARVVEAQLCDRLQQRSLQVALLLLLAALGGLLGWWRRAVGPICSAFHCRRGPLRPARRHHLGHCPGRRSERPRGGGASEGKLGQGDDCVDVGIGSPSQRPRTRIGGTAGSTEVSEVAAPYPHRNDTAPVARLVLNAELRKPCPRRLPDSIYM
eukprot:1302722-Pyramimonas_sp.AAC.1